MIVNDVQSYLNSRPFITGKGSSHSPLMIVADYPDENDSRRKEPFSGPPGNMLDEMLKKAGSSIQQCFKTHAFQRQPPGGNIKLVPKGMIEEGKKYLWSEIEAIKPNCILALGDLALELCSGKRGLTEYRGSILQSLGLPKVVASIHPRRLFLSSKEGGIGYEARTYVQLDINRAVDESKTSTLDLPKRVLQVAKSSSDIINFRRQYADRKRAASDIEVKHCIPNCVSIAFDPWHSMSVPLFNPKGFPQFIPEYQYPEIYECLYWIFQECEIIGQNWKFDSDKLDKIGLPSPKFYADTMLMAHVLHSELPKSLQFLASIYTREPYYKSELKEFNFHKSDIDDLFLYNAKDSAVTFEVYNAMVRDLIDLKFDTFYFNFQHKLHDLYRHIETTGIKFDRRIQKELWEQYGAHEERLQKELDTLVDHPVNVASPKQIKTLLFDELGFPRRESTNEETLVALYGNHTTTPLKKRVIDLILELRGVRKAKGTYIAIEPDFDDRVRFAYKIV